MARAGVNYQDLTEDPGGNWNTVPAASITSTGVLISDLDDLDTGSPTGWGLDHTNAFDVTREGDPSWSGGTFPQLAIDGSWSNNSGAGDNSTVRITGLDNSLTYNLEITGSRNLGGTNRMTRYSVPGETDIVIDATNNQTDIAVFSNVSPVSGNIDITVAGETPGTDFSYLNAFVITEPTVVTPLKGVISISGLVPTVNSTGTFVNPLAAPLAITGFIPDVAGDPPVQNASIPDQESGINNWFLLRCMDFFDNYTDLSSSARQQISFTATGLPPRFSITPDGLITGYPNSATVATVMIEATVPTNVGAATDTFDIDIGASHVTATVNVPYNIFFPVTPPGTSATLADAGIASNIVFTGPSAQTINRPFYYDGSASGEAIYGCFFRPDEEGSWTYEVSSSITAMEAQSGSFQVVVQPEADRHRVLTGNGRYIEDHDGNTIQMRLGGVGFGYSRERNLDEVMSAGSSRGSPRDLIDFLDSHGFEGILPTALLFTGSPVTQDTYTTIGTVFDQTYWRRIQISYLYAVEKGLAVRQLLFSDDAQAPTTADIGWDTTASASAVSTMDGRLMDYSRARFGAMPGWFQDAGIDVSEFRTIQWVEAYTTRYANNEDYYTVGSFLVGNRHGLQTASVHPDDGTWYSDDLRERPSRDHQSATYENTVLGAVDPPVVPAINSDRWDENSTAPQPDWPLNQHRSVFWELMLAGFQGGAVGDESAVQEIVFGGYLELDLEGLAYADDNLIIHDFIGSRVTPGTHQSLLKDDTLITTGSAVAAESPVQIIAYQEDGGQIEVDTSNHSGDYEFYYFNPRTGVADSPQSLTVGGTATFSASDTNDWVLVIQEAGSTIQPLVGQVQIIGFIPAVSIEVVASPEISGLQINGFAPSVQFDAVTVQPPIGEIQVVGYVPAIHKGEYGAFISALNPFSWWRMDVIDDSGSPSTTPDTGVAGPFDADVSGLNVLNGFSLAPDPGGDSIHSALTSGSSIVVDSPLSTYNFLHDGSDFTLSMFVQLDNIPSNNDGIFGNISVASQLGIQWLFTGAGSDNRFIFNISNGSSFVVQAITDPDVITGNDIHLVTLTKGGDDLTFYVDAVSVFIFDTGGTTFPTADADNSLRIGRNHTLNSLEGEIDETLIFDRELTQTEIRQILQGPGNSILPPSGEIQVVGYVPSVQLEGIVSVSPIVGGIGITGYVPGVSTEIGTLVSPEFGNISITGYAPNINADPASIVVPELGTITINGFAPSVQIPEIKVLPGVGELQIKGSMPEVIATGNWNLETDIGGTWRLVPDNT